MSRSTRAAKVIEIFRNGSVVREARVAYRETFQSDDRDGDMFRADDTSSRNDRCLENSAHIERSDRVVGVDDDIDIGQDIPNAHTYRRLDGLYNCESVLVVLIFYDIVQHIEPALQNRRIVDGRLIFFDAEKNYFRNDTLL